MSRPLRSSSTPSRRGTPKGAPRKGASPVRDASGAALPLPSDVVQFGAPQLELFPSRPIVEALDPRAVAGPRTGVLAIVKVRMTARGPVHLVFHDRHGWYCELHGAGCVAVALARE